MSDRNETFARYLPLMSEEMLEDAIVMVVPEELKEVWRSQWREVNVWTGTGTNRPNGIITK